MPISTDSPELFMAILAMDSYNRGYNNAVNVTGSQLGNASLTTDVDLPVGYQDVSFFAQTYHLPNNTTVISYRGTDQPGPDWNNGFSTGFGNILDPEAELASVGWATARCAP